MNDRTYLGSDGGFTFREATPGICQVRVLTLRGDVVYEQHVTLSEGMVLDIRIPKPEGSRPASGQVSARELAHPTPTKAIKEYVNAKKAEKAGDFDRAIGHYERAVQLHPQFMAAWNDLGVNLMNQKRVPEAAEAFRKAAALTAGSTPESTLINRNLGVALFRLQQLQP